MDTDIAGTCGSTLTDAIRRRRSIRRFQAREIQQDLLMRLIELACTAPSPHGSQPWRFTLLSGRARENLAAAMAERLRQKLVDAGVDEGKVETQIARSKARIGGAPNAILCSIVVEGLEMNGKEAHDALELQMAVQSVGAALQNLFLAAWEHGVATCWIAAPMYCPTEVRESLDLPEMYHPQALVLLGYPADSGRQRRPRLDLSSVVTTR